eukprot:CAMPEP_0197661272 /NCGR_PEP_ID=MMETSP1338-20131121/51355_1 /TAXON_ID=43686 ORGANISM="Pelagodinium beii, Strain RCC1491" /NCGR_SAMPLE_ID=MMETSP1338 /ASSEMBLY_ACC=CAM_ASM_000754 /LENGTH=574 /DNA_ID=CAMNT_0043238795 /DNA_START=32 /DNA_END=1756 /DNA_ORIENTATION=+
MPGVPSEDNCSSLRTPLLDEPKSPEAPVRRWSSETFAETPSFDKDAVDSRLHRTLTEYCAEGSRTTNSSAQWRKENLPGGKPKRQLKQQASDPTDYLYMSGGNAQESVVSPPKPNDFRLHFKAIREDAAGLGEGERSGLLDFVLDVSYDVKEHYWRMAQAKEKLADRASSSRQTSDLATVLVILKSFLGGTLLVAPGEFLTAGLVSGNLIFITFGMLELWCMLKLLHAYRQAGGASFGNLAKAALGPSGSVAVEVSIVASQVGFMATEMIYVARNGASALHWLLQNVSPGTGASSVSQENLAASITWLQLLLVVPFAWQRDLASLTTINFVGNLLVLSTTAALAVMAVWGLFEQGIAEDLTLLCPPPRALVFMGFSVFTFEGINMVIPMYESHREKDSFDRLLIGTIVAVISIFSLFASGNVLLYGTDLKPILTLNLPEDSVAVACVPLAFAVASLCLVPLLALPTFQVLEAGFRKTGSTLQSVVANDARINTFRTSVLVFCAVLARYGGPHLDDFLAVVGAVCCVPLALIYPAAIHLRLVAKSKLEAAGDWFCLSLGVGVTVLCTVEVFYPLN